MLNLIIVLCTIGAFGFIFNRGRNIIMFLVSLELLLLSVAILSLFFSFQMDDLLGYNIALFILPIAGAETAVALAYLVAFAPVRQSIIIM